MMCYLVRPQDMDLVIRQDNPSLRDVLDGVLRPASLSCHATNGPEE